MLTAIWPVGLVPAAVGSAASFCIVEGSSIVAAQTPSSGAETDRRRAALMAAAQAGDRAAYATLLRECVPLIRAVAGRRGLSADRIDDVVQETLYTVHRARHTYDPGRSFNAWLRTIADRRAIDVLRSTGRLSAREVHAPLAYENYPDHAGGAEQNLEQADRTAALKPAIAALPAGQREAVQHLMLHERSLAEAAAATGRSKGALKVNLHRALKTLRARLGGGA